MKKVIKIFSLCLIVLLSVSLFAGCSDDKIKDNGDDENKNANVVDLVLSEIDDISEYKIVRPDKSDGAKTALVTLRDALKEKLGIDLKVGTDFDSAVKKEILIGLTSRNESKEAAQGLRTGDFKILKTGTKIIIVGGSDIGLERAMDFITKYCISTERNSFAVPAGDGYFGKAKYVSDKITIDGVDIGEFTIVSTTYGDLESFSEKILYDVIGLKLKTSENTDDANKNYIIVENTGTVEDKFTISVEDGNILIIGSYNSTDYAIEYFCGKFLRDNGGKTVELKNGFKFEGSKGKKDIYTKDQLMTVLRDMYNDPDKFIVGQQAEQTGYLPSHSINNFVDTAGELPGMLGLDLGIYGMYIQKYTPAKWSRAICEIVDYVAQGGIVEFSSHMNNPADPSQFVLGELGEATTAAERNALFEELVTEGTDLNKAFKETISIDGKFLQDLRDNGVPVIWRPFHEMNGNWFWYTVTDSGVTADSEVWADVWRYVYDYYTKDLGLDNLIWVYAPNESDNTWDEVGKQKMSTIYCYPGNEYCDMVGVDVYFNAGLKPEINGYNEILDVTGYIGALTEFGPSSDLIANADKGEKQIDVFNSMDADTYLKNIKSTGGKFAYVLSWNGGISFTAMGKSDEFMALDYTIGAKELKTIFDGMK